MPVCPDILNIFCCISLPFGTKNEDCVSFLAHTDYSRTRGTIDEIDGMDFL